jgi:predicted Zn-dependent protease
MRIPDRETGDMSSEKRRRETEGGGEYSRREGSTHGRRRANVRPAQALYLGAVLLIGLLFARLHAGHPRRAVAPSTPPPTPTPFEASFSQAQRQYFRAGVIAKRQLETLEEWDPDALRGSTPEIYRRSTISRTREIGLAEEAAQEAIRQARTVDERYRVTRLLAHIECDRGHHCAELELARKLVALRPHHPEPLLMLARAAAECGQRELSRRAASEASRMSGSPAIQFLLPADQRNRLSHPRSPP